MFIATNITIIILLAKILSLTFIKKKKQCVLLTWYGIPNSIQFSDFEITNPYNIDS